MARQKNDIARKKTLTTLVSEDIQKEIKHIAVQKGKKYHEIIEEALRTFVKKEKTGRQK
jgi:predicted transcriptional regulator